MAEPASAAAAASAVPAASSSAVAAAAAAPVAPPPKPRDPDLSHLTSATFEHVYEPCEDSYLLMDALHKDLCVDGWRDKVGQGSRWKTAMEIGQTKRHSSDREIRRRSICKQLQTVRLKASLLALRLLALLSCLSLCAGPGSGIIISYLSALLDGRGFFWAVDVNPHACRTTRLTMRANRVRGDVVQGDLDSALAERLRGKLDVLVFNPPYVPTPASELLGEGISRSWAGGEKGRQVLDQLLPRIDALLAPGGVFYCVLLSSNVPAEVEQILKEHGGFSAQVRRAVHQISAAQLQLSARSAASPSTLHRSLVLVSTLSHNACLCVCLRLLSPVCVDCRWCCGGVPASRTSRSCATGDHTTNLHMARLQLPSNQPRKLSCLP